MNEEVKKIISKLNQFNKELIDIVEKTDFTYSNSIRPISDKLELWIKRLIFYGIISLTK